MNRYLCILVWLVLLAGGAAAATRYDGDGVLSARLELERWHINRARAVPEYESDLLNLTNSSNRSYDTCEGWAGDGGGTWGFGTTVGEWAQWTVAMQPLAPNAMLNAACSNHSADMADVGYLTHNSPTTNYYPLNSTPKQRQAAEGYSSTLIGYYENVAGGGQMSTDDYPLYGRSPYSVHTGLYIDGTEPTRGHRKAILNKDAREIGLGTARNQSHEYYGEPYSQWFYITRDYETQDFASRNSDHFYTGTIFHDANGNGVYDEGEGVGGIEVRLWDGAQEAAWFDASQPSGNFAIPIVGLTDGNTITVQLVNTNTGSRTVTVPLGYNALGEIDLAASESFNYGTFTQPATVRNVGLRETLPMVSLDGVLFATNATISFTSLMRAVYEVESTESLMPAQWTNFLVVTAAQEVSQVVDTGQGGRPPPASVPHRFYRIRLRRD